VAYNFQILSDVKELTTDLTSKFLTNAKISVFNVAVKKLKINQLVLLKNFQNTSG
jgi:hypothetical protein